jgi:hypothetical protein
MSSAYDGPHVLNWIFNYILPVILTTFGFRYSKWYPTHVITRHNYTPYGTSATATYGAGTGTGMGAGTGASGTSATTYRT